MNSNVKLHEYLSNMFLMKNYVYLLVSFTMYCRARCNVQFETIRYVTLFKYG